MFASILDIQKAKITHKCKLRQNLKFEYATKTRVNYCKGAKYGKSPRTYRHQRC